jgi:predicted signal transduction protein with EAL and GGDEF domain
VPRSVRRGPFAIENDAQVDATVSIGFAAFPFVTSAPRAVSWGQVIAIADRALYMAKEAGRNACVGLVATSTLDVERLCEELGKSIDDAIRGGDVDAVRPVRVLS